MNAPRLKVIIDRIKKKPDCWNQAVFHDAFCGTAHCIAGHAQLDMLKANGKKVKYLLSSHAVVRNGFLGLKEKQRYAFYDGQEWLGLTRMEANYLFAPHRTLLEIEAFYHEHAQE